MNKPNAVQKLAADLAALANAATPGPWVADGDLVNEHGNVISSYIANGRSAGGRIAAAFASCLVKTDEQCQANAAFIAGANPKAVLVLTSEIAHLEAEVDTLTAIGKAIRDEWRKDQAEVERLTNNRDMWKAQSKRQVQELADLQEDVGMFRWLTNKCGDSFRIDLDADSGQWALGYDGEMGLRDSLRAAIQEGQRVATQNASNENVSRHEGG